MAADQLSFMLEPDHSQVGIFKETNRVTATVEVLVSTVQSELACYRERLGFKRPFLRMDTQGNDLSVAEGAGESLSTFVGIQSEIAVKRICRRSRPTTRRRWSTISAEVLSCPLWCPTTPAVSRDWWRLTAFSTARTWSRLVS